MLKAKCAAYTQTGLVCENYANGSGFCHVHDPNGDEGRRRLMQAEQMRVYHAKRRIETESKWNIYFEKGQRCSICGVWARIEVRVFEQEDSPVLFCQYCSRDIEDDRQN